MAPAWLAATNQKANSDLLRAARAGDELNVAAALAQPGVNVNCCDKGYYRRTPLLLACNPVDGKTNPSVVRLLLEDSRVNVNAGDIQGKTALHTCGDQVELLEILLSKRTDIDWNAADMIGQTPLLWFAQMGDEESVRRLIGVESVNLFATTIDVFTALHQVAERKTFPSGIRSGDISKRCNIVDLVLKEVGRRGDDVSIDANVRATVNASNPDKLKPFEGPDYERCRPHLILKTPKEQPSRDLTPLHFAVMDGRMEVVRLLLQWEGINIDAVDSAGLTPLYYSVQNGHWEMVDLFLKKGKPFATLDSDRNCGVFQDLLLFATKRGHVEAVQELLVHPNLDVNAKDNKKMTPLLYAIEARNVDMVKVLCRKDNFHRLRATEENSDGDTPLQIVVEANNLSEDPDLKAIEQVLLERPEVQMQPCRALMMPSLEQSSCL
ncbi:unnamed protein product [Sphagnum jensenii]|uniref:Uncharacterized protein n=1 Tax=Sphagnum jensenii TaxID=128206 RepID=A0ABP0WUP4_9BRYO